MYMYAREEKAAMAAHGMAREGEGAARGVRGAASGQKRAAGAGLVGRPASETGDGRRE